MLDGTTALSGRHFRRTTRWAPDRPTAATLDALAVLPRQSAAVHRSDRRGYGQKPAVPLPDGFAVGRSRTSSIGKPLQSTAEPGAIGRLPTRTGLSHRGAAAGRTARPACGI